MNDNPQEKLIKFKPEKEFFIGIDSDGCVFDTMEIKHKECFCPNYIKYFGLQRISKYAREVWEFVNLYSKTRGINRFKALLRADELLAERPEIRARNPQLPNFEPLKFWMKKETKLGNPALGEFADKTGDTTLRNIYDWSLAVNKTIGEMVRDIPPFRFVVDSLEKLKDKADAAVVSQTPVEALEREWKEHEIDRFVRIIAGQEFGTKAEHLKLAAEGKYGKNKILMIGDAPGDLKAAKTNGFLFYPINPGGEENSWRRFFSEALDIFFEGKYDGKYEERLIDEFNGCLPENPEWRAG